MSYRNGIFSKKETERRALRDRMRDAFFAEIGLPRLTDPMRLDADPAQQHNKIIELLNIARSKHTDEISALDMMEVSLLQLAFGLLVQPIKRPNQISLHSVSAEAMQHANFNMTWAGWFDG